MSISFPELRSPWPAVGKRELWEHPFQACTIDTIDADCALRSETGYAEFGYFLCYFKMDAPRALVFRPLVKGNEALGTRLSLCLDEAMWTPKKLIKWFSKARANLKRQICVYILSSKHSHRPMSARVVSQLFHNISYIALTVARSGCSECFGISTYSQLQT